MIQNWGMSKFMILMTTAILKETHIIEERKRVLLSSILTRKLLAIRHSTSQEVWSILNLNNMIILLAWTETMLESSTYLNLVKQTTHTTNTSCESFTINLRRREVTRPGWTTWVSVRVDDNWVIFKNGMKRVVIIEQCVANHNPNKFFPSKYTSRHLPPSYISPQIDRFSVQP